MADNYCGWGDNYSTDGDSCLASVLTIDRVQKELPQLLNDDPDLTIDMMTAKVVSAPLLLSLKEDGTMDILRPKNNNDKGSPNDIKTDISAEKSARSNTSDDDEGNRSQSNRSYYASTEYTADSDGFVGWKSEKSSSSSKRRRRRRRRRKDTSRRKLSPHEDDDHSFLSVQHSVPHPEELLHTQRQSQSISTSQQQQKSQSVISSADSDGFIGWGARSSSVASSSVYAESQQYQHSSSSQVEEEEEEDEEGDVLQPTLMPINDTKSKSKRVSRRNIMMTSNQTESQVEFPKEELDEEDDEDCEVSCEESSVDSHTSNRSPQHDSNTKEESAAGEESDNSDVSSVASNTKNNTIQISKSGQSNNSLKSLDDSTTDGSISISSSVSSMTNKSAIPRRSAAECRRRSLDTINSEAEYRNSERSDSELRQSLRKCLSKQQESFRKLQHQYGDEENGDDEVADEDKNVTEPTKTRDEQATTVVAKVYGWGDNESDDDDSLKSDNTSLLSKSLRSLNTSVKGRLSASMKSFGPTTIDFKKKEKNKKRRRQRTSGGASVTSSHASFKASQYDSYADGDGLCEDFVPRGSFDTANPPPKQESNNRDLLNLMMEEEYDAKKPWLKAPGGGTVVVTNKQGQLQQSSLNRRATGASIQSSFTSDIMFHDEVFETPPPLPKPEEAPTTKAVDDDKEQAVTDKITSETDYCDDTQRTVSRISTASACDVATLTSALSDDDDGSELTELREAQDALFSVPESVRSASSRSNAGDDDDDCSQSVLSDASSQISSRDHHDGTTPIVYPPHLSSLDIVHEEDSDQYNFNHYHQQQSHHKEWQPQKHLPPVIEHGGNEVEELDELLTSSATNDPLRKSLGKLDDDSASYSDFDAETGIQAPSIKMCMTVKDSAIEREFDTEQLHDVEYGETNGASPFDEEGEMTLKDLLETPTQIERDDDSYCPIDDSARLDDNTSSSKKSKRKPPKLNFSTKNSFLSRKVNSSSKKIRRRNKRVYKFCVWNCRRITISVTLVICILIGISVISWWGAGKATMGSSDNASEDDGKIEDQQNTAINTDRASSLVPTSSNSPTQLPSLSPSLRGSINSDGMGDVVVPQLNNSTANDTLLPSSAPNTSLSPITINDHNNSSLNTSYYSIMPSTSPSSNTSIIIESSTLSNNETSDYSEMPSSFPSSSPSLNSSIDAPIVNPNITFANNQSSLIINDVPSAYESNQIVFGGQLEHAGSSVSMSPNSDVIAVGFKEANSMLTDKTGLVRVYKRNDGDTNNTYTPLGQDLFGRASGDEYGSSVSISNDGMRVVVGSRSFSSSSDMQKNGEVTIFQYSNISDSWTQMGSSIQGDAEKDRLGWSVSMSGDGNRVAVGAPRANGGTGSVTIYENNGTEWRLLASVNGDKNGDRAGFSMSLSNDGSTIAIGAFTSSLEGLANSGRVDIYQLVQQGSSDESPSLVKQGQTIVGSTAGSQLGYSVAISGDGTRVGIGSNGYSTSNITRAGLCEVYEFQEQSWSKTGYLIGEEENEETGLHVSISLSGNLVGCSKNTYGQGAVTILEEGREGWKIKDTVTSSLDDVASFGVAVSLSQYGNTIVAGAPSFNASAGLFEVFSTKEE